MIVWDVEHAAAVETLAGHAAKITGLAISSDGSTLYSSSLDSKVLIWDLAGDRRLGRPFEVGPDAGELLRSSLSPDGRTLAVGQPDGRVALLDARTLRALSKFRVVPKGAVTGIGFVPGGRLLAVGGDNGFLALVDPWRGEIVKRLVGHRPNARTAFAHGVFTPSFAADGHLMATTADDNTVRLWALPSGRPVGSALRYPTVGDVSLSPDGRTLAVTVPEGVANPGVRIVDVATRRQRASLFGDEAISDLARFTPDGRFLVGGSWKGWVRLWSTDTWKPASRPLTGHAGAILGQSMSPDGRTLATGSADGTIRLWDLRTRAAARCRVARAAEPWGHSPIQPRRGSPVRGLRHGARLPLGRATLLVGAPGLCRGRPPAHSIRMGRRVARPGVRPSLLTRMPTSRIESAEATIAEWSVVRRVRSPCSASDAGRPISAPGSGSEKCTTSPVGERPPEL